MSPAKHDAEIKLRDPAGFVNYVHATGAQTRRNSGLNANLTFQARDHSEPATSGYNYAAWEVYSDNQDAYGEGGIWINADGEAFDYDGAFTCPPILLDELARLGYDVAQIDHRRDDR